MNKIFLSVLIFSFFALSNSFAQSFSNKKQAKSQLYSMNFSLGAFADTYFNLDLDQLESRIDDSDYRRMDLTGFSSTHYAVTNAGASFNMNFRFGKEQQGYFTNREFGLSVIAGRELVIYYDKNDIQAQNFESITFCDMQNEIAISGLQRIGFNSSNILKLYTGLGGQLGTTVGSQFWVFSSLLEEDDATGEAVFNEMSFDTRSSMFGRLYVPFGAELVAFKKISVGAEARLGYGLQQVVGRKSYGGINYGFKLSAGWIF